MSIIRIENLTHSVALPNGKKLDILEDFSLKIEEKSTTSIVGASGSGKTTLMSLMAGLDKPTKGEIWVDGQPFHEISEEARTIARRDNIAFIFQSFHLLTALTALENVMLPLEVMGKAERETSHEEESREIMHKLGLEARIESFPNMLSGGEQQRVAIARAFVQSPRILFADEPTGNLDAETGQQIVDMIFALNKERKTTLVLVSHNPEIAALCDNQVKL